MKKGRVRKKRDKVLLVSSVICMIVLFLTIGFSSYQTRLEVESLGALVRIQRDIRITGVSVSSANNGGVYSYTDYNINTIYSRIALPNKDSTITFDVEVTNLGNVEMALSSITNLDNNLKYTITGYNLDDALCDDGDATSCKLGSVTTLHVTIGYKDSSEATNTPFLISPNFNFISLGKAAKIGDTYYDTLQLAVNAVPTNKTETTIILLKDVSETITVAQNKNIVFDFQNKTLSNNGNNPVIKNNGTVNIISGIIRSDASTNGAINNESTGNITINGASVIVTGGRQALYNNKGTALITGDSYLSATTTERVAVQNLAGGTLTITGGTIVSTGSSAVGNAGTMTIGVKDGDIDITTPVMQGLENGINSSTNYSFYNGVAKGKSAPINNLARITDKEDGYDLVQGEESIYGERYVVAVLGIANTVTFNPNGGTVGETRRGIAAGYKVGTLPIPTRSGYEFIGWFTKQTEGSEVSENTIINNDVIFYAHWRKVDTVRINSTYYGTIQEAINSVSPNNVEVTIVLIRDTSEHITVAKNQNIVLDLQNYTISSNKDAAIIENNGTVKIQNGTITSNVDTGAINNNGTGKLIITGGNIIATGSRQAVYNLAGGVVEISGGYLSSKTSGKPTNSNMDRATLQNLLGGIMKITGGTIVGVNQQAISNEGTLTLGVEDGTISATSPIIQGKTIGIKTDGTFNFYDGVIKGTSTDVIDGTITDQEDDGILTDGTEVIDGTTYNTKYFTN